MAISSKEFREKYGRKNARFKKTRKDCLGGCRGGMARFHDSIEEANYCDYLKFLQKAGEIESYEGQKTFTLHDPQGNRAGAHRVDFVIIRNGKTEVHEYKGSLFAKLPEYKTKRALFRHCYPDIEYTTVTKNDILNW